MNALLDVAVVIGFFAIIGWLVHELMGRGNHGVGLLHYAFVGGVGTGLATIFEKIAGASMTLSGVIALCVICACVVEYTIRRIKHKLLVQDIHRRGWLTQDDIDEEFDVAKDDLKGWENVELDDED